MISRRILLQRYIFMLLFSILMANTTLMAKAQCELRLVNVTTVNFDFSREVIPRQDDGSIQIRVDFEVSGGATNPFDLVCRMDGYEYRQHFDRLNPGRHSAIYHFTTPLETSSEARVILDIDGTSGDNNRGNNSFSGKLRIIPVPTMPAVLRIQPQEYLLIEQLNFRFAPTEAGKTVTLGFARVRNTSTTQVLRSAKNESAEGDADGVEHTVVIGAGGIVNYERRTHVRFHNIAINPAKLDKVTWEDFKKDPQPTFLRLSKLLDGDSEPARKFIRDTLGEDYREKLTPFAAAKRLFRAIKAQFYYEVTDIYLPSTVLQSKRGQCTAGARLMCALLRQIGIPARTVGGFFVYQSGKGHEGHQMCEFYFPNIGWIPCDPTPDEHPQPGGNLYQFGYQWQTNQLWAGYADAALYETGVRTGLLRGPKPIAHDAKYTLQKLNEPKTP